MKNLKKIAALVIVLAMALSTVSFAAFTDVKEDASYNEAVTVMSALGLLKGYEDGTFGPDKTITRAEFAAVVVRMLGMEDAAAGAATATNFEDVPATHWAAGYVKIANQKEIIAGYGNGKFGPDDEVTYEQAIKMLVCSLGYAPMFAEVKDAYPTSYMAQANTLGMTVGAPGKIGDKATRATVARLVYNALDDKIMEQVSFGKEAEYGIPTLYSTPLAQYLKVAKVDATVAPVGFSLEDAAKVNLTNIAYNGVGAGMYGGEYRDVTIADGDFDAVEGLTIPKGYAVTAFIDYNEDDMVVLAVVPKAGKNEVLELTATQMEEGVLDFSAESLEYYKVSATESSRTEEIKLDGSIEVYVNQNTAAEAASKYASIESKYVAGGIPSIKLINNDNDKAYDVMIITEYTAGVVEEIYDASERISTTDGFTYKFDKEIEDQTYTLKDVNGKELKFADIKKGDIINVIKSEDSTSNKFFEYIISSDKVEGTVTEKSSDNTKVYIGGKEYKVGNTTVEAGDKGIFYVDICGVILDKELDASSRTFGLLYTTYDDVNGADTEVKATILTKDGKFENFTFAKNVDIDGTTTAKANIVKGFMAAPQVVMYSANAAGAINSIYPAAKIYSATDGDYTYTAKKTNEAFDAIDASIDGMYVTDSSVVVAYKNDTLSNVNAKEDYALSSKVLFADEEVYDIEYVSDINDEIVYMIVYDAKAKVEPTNPVMYVSADPAKGETADGDAYYIIKGYVNGELKTFNADLETWVEYANGTTAATDYDPALITKGALVQYNEGEITNAIRVIATATDVENAAKGSALTFGVDAKDEETGYLYAGEVKEYKNGNISFADGTKVAFKAGTPSVKVTLNSGSVNRIFAGYTVAEAETEKNAGVGENDDVVIIYNFDKENKACVIIDVLGDND